MVAMVPLDGPLGEIIERSGSYGLLLSYYSSMQKRSHKYGMPWWTLVTLGLVCFLSTLGLEWFVGAFMFVISAAIISSGSSPWHGGKL